LNAIKQQLLNYCRDYLRTRIQAAEEANRELQEAANEETKSSAGDKYETGRSMMQLEMEKNSMQLTETLRLLQILERLRVDVTPEAIQPGSLALTDQGNFFISISVGKIVIGEAVYMAVSADSPIGALLLGKKKGDTFTFNKKTYTLKQVL
jgi:hypothetical protein